MSSLLTEHTAARRLSVTINRLRALVRESQIPYIELPDGEIRFDAQDLQEWIESRRRGENLAKIGVGSF